MGFDATPKIIDGGVYFQTIGNAKTAPQTGFANWFADFPHPKNFMFLVDGKSIQPTNNQNYGNVDDPEITSGIARLNKVPVDDETTTEWKDAQRRGRGAGLGRPVRAPQARDVLLGADGLRQLLDLPSGLLQRLLELLPQVVAARSGGRPWRPPDVLD